MEGRYKVEEVRWSSLLHHFNMIFQNINFQSFLKVMGVTDEAKIEEMIKATKEELNNIDQKISPV